MKNITIVLISVFIFSCSSDSENNDSNNGGSTINPFNGEWTGTFEEVISQSSVLDTGVWQGTVDTQNNFTGVETNLTDNESYDFSGIVSPDGDTSIAIGATTNGTVFTGVFYGNEASGVFVSNSSSPPNYGTWKGTKTIPDNDFIFSDFVGTWRLLSEEENGFDLFLTDCQKNSTIVASPSAILINEYSDSQFCGFNSCSIYSLESWDILYNSSSSATITQTSDINFCNGEADDTDTSLQLDINFVVSGDTLTISYELPNDDGSTSLVNKTYQRI